MEIHQLRYFIAVAEAGTFSAAAEKVRIAQPSLSQQMQKLEAELGQPLFDRLARRVVLTEAGHGFMPFARRILNELSAAQHFVEDLGKAPRGVVRLGILPTFAPYVIRALIQRVDKTLPEVNLSLTEGTTDQLVRMVDGGELDLAIISTCRATTGLHIDLWTNEELLVALPVDHRLAPRQTLAPRDLTRETVLLLHESHCLARQIQRWCGLHRIRHQRVGALQLGTMLELIAAGKGITLVPRMAASEPREGVVFVPFRGLAPEREINLLRNASHYLGKAALAIAAAAREELVRLVTTRTLPRSLPPGS